MPNIGPYIYTCIWLVGEPVLDVLNDDLLVTLLSKAEVAVDTAGLPFIADVVAIVVGFGFACMEEINWFDTGKLAIQYESPCTPQLKLKTGKSEQPYRNP